MHLTHCVKVGDRIVYIGFEEDARKVALIRNEQYPDEYRVEWYEPERSTR